MKNFVHFKEGNIVLSAEDLLRMEEEGSLSTTITKLVKLEGFFAANATEDLDIILPLESLETWLSI